MNMTFEQLVMIKNEFEKSEAEYLDYRNSSRNISSTNTTNFFENTKKLIEAGKLYYNDPEITLNEIIGRINGQLAQINEMLNEENVIRK